MAWPAWLLDLWTTVKPYADRAAVWRGYEAELQTLAIFGIGVAVYTALVFAFYQNISKRKPFHLPTSDRPGWAGRMSRFSERALIFPLTSFAYFVVLASALFFLTKATVPTSFVLLVAMAVVVGVRVTVYLSEAMSNDLSKLVPLSLLAVLLVDPGYLKLGDAWGRFAEAVQMWPLLTRYFLFFIALEAVFSSARWTVLKINARTRGSAPRKSVSVAVKEPTKPAPPPKAP